MCGDTNDIRGIVGTAMGGPHQASSKQKSCANYRNKLSRTDITLFVGSCLRGSCEPSKSNFPAICAGTPDAIKDRLNKEVVKVLESDAVKAKLLESGLVPTPSTRQEATAYQKDQLQVWTTMVKDLNLKLE